MLEHGRAILTHEEKRDKEFDAVVEASNVAKRITEAVPLPLHHEHVIR